MMPFFLRGVSECLLGNVFGAVSSPFNSAFSPIKVGVSPGAGFELTWESSAG